MTLMESIEQRHSVRKYTDQKIEGNYLTELNAVIDECNKEGDLNIQLCLDEPEAFDSRMAKYGKFENVRNYVALVGKKSDDLQEKCGYYGEKIVIKAQQMGINTCWVGGTFSRGKTKRIITINPGEKLTLIISIGFGETQGITNSRKPLENFYESKSDIPQWFMNGVKAAQLAPTAMNQQKFKFKLEGDKVTATAGSGFFTKADLGIAKYHFDIGSGKNVFSK